jgi:hypothetical protein
MKFSLAFWPASATSCYQLVGSLSAIGYALGSISPGCTTKWASEPLLCYGTNPDIADWPMPDSTVDIATELTAMWAMPLKF